MTNTRHSLANVAVVDRLAMTDPRISFGARGLLVWLLHQPDDFVPSIQRMADAGPDTKDKVRKYVQELEQFGYVQRSKKHNKNGHFFVDYEVTDSPESVTETAPQSLRLICTFEVQ